MLPAKNIQLPLLEPNILYIDEKPTKIMKKPNSTKRKKSTKKPVKKKENSKTRKCKTIQKHDILEVKNENILNKYDEEVKIDNDDPLLTTNIEIKCELSKEKYEPEEEGDENVAESYIDSINDSDKNFCVEEYEVDNYDDDNDEEEFEFKDKLEIPNNDSDNSEEDYEEEEEDLDEDDQDDEPLILLTQMLGSKKYKKKKRKPRLHNCPDTCKHKCTTKYDKQRRIDIFDYYWDLSDEDKVNFIRKHMRKRVLQRIRTTNGRNNCCYFLKHYKTGKNSITELSDVKDDPELTKVCRAFFKNTLRISDSEIKDSIEGYELQRERIVLPPRDETNKDLCTLVKKPPNRTLRYLDPETGNLTATKSKRKRRKPDDPQPERFPKPIHCSIRCIFKCHLNFTEEERKKICDIFWSLDFKRRKDFILARIETNDVKTHITPEFRKTNRPTRTYQTKFYLRSSLNSENKRVCKHFMMNTLCINRFFIENAIKYADKTTGSYAGQDRRGGHSSHNKISEERKQIVKDHISSYPFWIPNKKSKTKYLHHSLSIKKMYMSYKEKCLSSQENYVSTRYYYRVFHEDFRLAFLTNPHAKGGGFLLANPNLSHYTGEEPGGFWVDSKDNILDIRSINLGQSLNAQQNNYIIDSSGDTSLVENTFTSEATTSQALNVINSTSFMPLQLLKPVLNPVLYGNLQTS